MAARPGYHLEAGGLRIETPGTATARVQTDGLKTVTVAALHGSVRVLNGSGELVTEVDSNSAYTFEADADAPLPGAVQGCLFAVGDRFVLLDGPTNTALEVRGSMLGALVGSRVEVKGKNATCAKPLEGTTKVINVTEAKRLSDGGCGPIRDAFMAAHPNISTERRTKTKCKVIAGVLLSGAAGGIAAGVCCKDTKTPVSVQ
jgi:hypothetical protein